MNKKSRPRNVKDRVVDVYLCDQYNSIEGIYGASYTTPSACQKKLDENWGSPPNVTEAIMQAPIPADMVVDGYAIEIRDGWWDDECTHTGKIYLRIEGYVPMTDKEIETKKRQAEKAKAARANAVAARKAKTLKDIARAVKADPTLKDSLADLIKE